jgi:23S rRNA (cytosine1962-C5)-methyltransferase
MKEIDRLIDAAMEKRAQLLDEDTNAARLIHDSGDGFPGVTVDKLADVVLVEAHTKAADAESLISALKRRFGGNTPIFYKERWSRTEQGRSGAQRTGPPCRPELAVREHGLSYWVRLTSEEHIGLFLDSRPARKRIREITAGRRVLNLFSYTGAFGVCASKGGARSTTNVDNKRSALELGKINYRLNCLDHDTRTFLRADAFQFLGRAVRGKGRYDLIVLDPPPISKRAGRRRFRVETGYAGLAVNSLKLLDSGGLLLAGLNGSRVGDHAFDRMILDAAALAQKRARIVERIGPGADFPRCDSRPVARFVLVAGDEG